MPEQAPAAWVACGVKSGDTCAVCSANLRLVGSRHRCVGNAKVTDKPVSQSVFNKLSLYLTGYLTGCTAGVAPIERHIAP
jgi:hypothetical protein